MGKVEAGKLSTDEVEDRLKVKEVSDGVVVGGKGSMRRREQVKTRVGRVEDDGQVVVKDPEVW